MCASIAVNNRATSTRSSLTEVASSPPPEASSLCRASPKKGSDERRRGEGSLLSLGFEPPHPNPLPTQVGLARLARDLRRDPGKAGARGERERTETAAPSLVTRRRL